MKCSRCGGNIPTGATSCGTCGAKITMGKRCPFCQNVIPANAIKCPKCGRALTAQATAAPQKVINQKSKPKGAFRWWQIPIALLIFAFGIGVGAILFSGPGTADVKEPDKKDTTSSQLQATPQPLETPTEPPAEKTSYKIGETWTVEGQWELTITGVTETEERNEFSDQTPGAVYILDFTYKNIGYVDDNGIMDGLFFSMDDTIVDCKGKMGESYPGTITKNPQETPVGATCEGQSCIAVENPGPFTLTVIQYDGNSEKRSATFEVAVG